jgi:hypothetical protein
MAYPKNGGLHHDVYCSGAVAKSIRDVQKQALKQGRGQAMLDAFRQAVQRLHSNPRDFGEALFRLPALRMEVYTAVVRPITIDFAVCTDRPLVFIKGVKLLGT